LLNALTRQHRLARTSGSPGCTRQLTFFDVETADAAALTLVDLPGYGFAQRSHSERRQWGEWIDTYLTERPTLRAVLVLFDVRRGVGPEERDLLTFLREERRGRQRPALILTATKLDELAVAKRKPRIAELQREIGAPLLGTAIADQRSIDRLWQHIRGSVGLGQGTLPAASLP
jgi:GTP-binding protein